MDLAAFETRQLNAFNSIERDSMLHQVKDITPSLFPF
jgi:hypothetical protein